MPVEPRLFLTQITNHRGVPRDPGDPMRFLVLTSAWKAVLVLVLTAETLTQHPTPSISPPLCMPALSVMTLSGLQVPSLNTHSFLKVP